MICIGALVYRPAVQLQALVLAVYVSTHMQYKYTDQETIYVGSHMSVQSNAVVLYSDSRMSGIKVGLFLYHDSSRLHCARHLESGKAHYLGGSHGSSGLTCWLKVSGRALRSSSSAVISAPEGIRLEFCREGRCDGVDRAFMSSAFLPPHTLSDGTLPWFAGGHAASYWQT